MSAEADSPAEELKPATTPASDEATHAAVVRSTINANFIDLAVKFGKVFLALWLVYYMGYYQFSIAWIVVGLGVYVVREKYRREKDFTLGIARAAAVNEKASILARVEDLPTWVYFPDTERAEWVNKMLLQLWPYVGHYVKDFILQNIEPMMVEAVKSSTKFGSFKFDRIDLGDIAPRIGGIKVYREHISRHEIIMDLELFYTGDCNFQVIISKLKAGIKDLQVHGTLRVIFKPLINEMPLIGGVQYFFLNTPVIDFNLTNLADVLDIPGLGDVLRKVVADQIAYLMVLPNKMSIKLSDSVPSKLLRFNEPAGVVRIHLLEGRDLMRKDVGILGLGKSDPYGIISVGAQEYRTKVINNTINPVWDYFCEATVDQMRGQYIGMVFYDKDKGNWDDFLGRLSVEIQTIASKGAADMWIPLEDATSGQVHMKIQWLALSSDPIDLHVQQKEVEMMKELGLCTSLLLVYVDSARNLPNASKIPTEPCPMVKLVLGTQKFETAALKNTNDPVWEEGFKFRVVNPELQELLIEIVDQRSAKSLGSLTYGVSRLLHCDNLEQSQPFHLKNSGPQSKIILSFQLRILKSGVTVPLDIRSDSSDSAHSRSGSESRPGSSRASPVRTANSSRGQSPDDSTNKTADSSPTTKSADTLDVKLLETTLRQRTMKEPSTETEHGLGQIQLTLRYSQQRNRLIVVVHKVIDLPFFEINDPPDPYVKMYLQPDRNRDSKRKTQSIKNTCNPVYDETFDYMMSQHDLNNIQLSVTVNNRSSSMFVKSFVIGQVIVDLSQIDLTKATTSWFHLAPFVQAAN